MPEIVYVLNPLLARVVEYLSTKNRIIFLTSQTDECSKYAKRLIPRNLKSCSWINRDSLKKFFRLVYPLLYPELVGQQYNKQKVEMVKKRVERLFGINFSEERFNDMLNEAYIILGNDFTPGKISPGYTVLTSNKDSDLDTMCGRNKFPHLFISKPEDAIIIDDQLSYYNNVDHGIPADNIVECSVNTGYDTRIKNVIGSLSKIT